MDLSAPEGHSVNEGIPMKLCSLSYMSVNDVVVQVLMCWKESQMTNIDIQ